MDLLSVDRAPQADAHGRAYLLLTLTALCWGANAVFGRLAVGEISPMALVTLRWLGALVLLVVFARDHVRRDWSVLRTRLPFVSAMGVLGFTAFNALFYTAAHTTTAVNIGIIQGAIPVFVLIGAFAVYRTRVTWLQAIGVCVAMGGVVILAIGGNLTHVATLTIINHGDVLMIAACVFYAAYTVGLRRCPPVSALSLLTLMAGAAFVASLPLALGEAALDRFQWPTTTGWIIVVVVAVFPSFLAQVFFIHGVKLIGPGRAGIFVNLVPVFASILAVTFLKEPFEALHVIALGLVLGGIWLAERGKANCSSKKQEGRSQEQNGVRRF